MGNVRLSVRQVQHEEIRGIPLTLTLSLQGRGQKRDPFLSLDGERECRRETFRVAQGDNRV
jgi:hypothetical protein